MKVLFTTIFALSAAIAITAPEPWKCEDGVNYKIPKSCHHFYACNEEKLVRMDCAKGTFFNGKRGT
jgi:hypothetical protein